MGWPTGPRGPGSRSLDSTRRSDVRPGRPGELATGGSQAGAWSPAPGRCARCAEPHLEQDSPETDTGTGERRARKLARGVRWGAGGKGLPWQYLACGLPDFVVLHPSLQGVEKARTIVEHWLRGIGLQLSPQKTKITHTLTRYEGHVGFDFLGQTVRQYPVGKTRSGKNGNGQLLGFKTFITPSKEAIKRHVKELATVVHADSAAPQEALIGHLNPIVTGWTNYHRTVVAKRAFKHCDNRLYSLLRRWARRRHPNKTPKWVSHKYWALDQGAGWTFRAPDGSVLKRHSAPPIKRHVKVKGTASPYDGNLIYWAQRLKDHPLTSSRTAYLLKLQQGRCASCGLYFKGGELLETDHIIPRRLGGDDRLMNLQLLHRHCHDRKTAQDGSNQARTGQGIPDKDHLIEEPCARKRCAMSRIERIATRGGRSSRQ